MYASRRAAEIRTAFQNEFLGKHAPCQTYYAALVYFDMVDDKEQAAKWLAEVVQQAGGHIEAGIFGAYIVPRVLRDYGYFDIAWEMVCKEDYPGWIYMMNQSHGAMAEQWNGSSSLDHHMYTAVDGFIQESLSGLDFNLGKTELQQLYLKPYFPRGMKKFSFWHQFHEGKIEISWDMETYRVVLPEGMEATLELAGEKYVLKAGENVFNKDI